MDGGTALSVGRTSTVSSAQHPEDKTSPQTRAFRAFALLKVFGRPTHHAELRAGTTQGGRNYWMFQAVLVPAFGSGGDPAGLVATRADLQTMRVTPTRHTQRLRNLKNYYEIGCASDPVDHAQSRKRFELSLHS